MNIVLTMTLSSSVLFLLYVIVDYFNADFFSPFLKYMILKVALLFSFLPIAYIKRVIGLLTGQTFSNIEINGQRQVLMVTPGERYATTAYSSNHLIVGIWLGVAVLVFLICVKRYLKCRRGILLTSWEETDCGALLILQKYRVLLKIKRKVRLYKTQSNISPFTIGIINPVIIMPAQLSPYRQELVLRHELCHIKRFDCLVKFLQILAVGAYWFNPLVYILDAYLENICEQSCDEKVTKNMTYEERKEYGHLIIELASTNGMWTSHIIPFSDSKNSVKERILLIMTPKRKHSKSAILFALGMAGVSCFPAFAYQKPAIVVWESQPNEDIFLQNAKHSVTFMEQNNDNMFFVNFDSVIYDEQFIDQNGNVFPIRSERKKCKEHTYVDGIYQKHTKNKDNSCLTKSYNCQRCKKCGIMKLGSLVNENKYTRCPH